MMDSTEEGKPLLDSPSVQRVTPSNSRKRLLLVLGLVSLTVTLCVALVTWSKGSGNPSSGDGHPDFALQYQEPVEDRVKAIFSSVFKTNVDLEYHAPPEYIVNLDLPPEQRWIQVAKDYKYILPHVIKEILEVVIPKVFIPLIQKLAGVLENTLHKEYAAELRGMAEVAGMEVGGLIIGNIVYDLTAHCTSIVAQDSAGQIWHARNMDYDFTEILKDITINVSFQRGGKTVYKATTFAGYVGILTAQKPHKFTISADQRDSGTPMWENWLTALLDSKAHLMSFAIREAFEKSESFAQILEMLSVVDTPAPVYYIIGGVNPGEGAVITKARLEAVDVWFLNTEQGRWYLVETNYDHWEPPPYSDDRRNPAKRAMNSTGQDGISTEAFFDILHLPKVRQETTVYTSVMRAAQPDVYTTRVWAKNDTTIIRVPYVGLANGTVKTNKCTLFTITMVMLLFSKITWF